MEYTGLRIERDGRIGRIVLNRPEQLNAINAALHEEIPRAFDELGTDEEVRVIIFKGAGRAFCAGFDTKSMVRGYTANQVRPWPDAAREMLAIRSWHGMLFKIWDCPKPVIAQLHGYAVGWGHILTLFCDLRYISDDFKVFHVSGVTGAHLAQIWLWFVGMTRAKEFEFRRNYRFGADELVAMGYANRVFPAAELEGNVEAIAAEIANTHPLFLRIQKLALNRVFDLRGFRESVYSSDDLDALLHWSVPGIENYRQLKEAGGDRRAMASKQTRGDYW